MTSHLAPSLLWPGRPVVSPLPLPGELVDLQESESRDLRLVAGDNLSSLGCLLEEAETRGQVMLAYLDPPFLTGRQHYVAGGGPAAFDDRWQDMGDYLNHLEPRLRVVRELLHPRGSLVIHVDPKTSHYVKILCDEIFGPNAFASEVIWRYRRWPAKTQNFQRVHDVMLRYQKDPSQAPTFHQLYEELAPSTRAVWGSRKQKAVTGETGRRLRSSKTEELSPGTPLGDVWDISIVAPMAKERTGYPTQKPEALLERWISACTSEGDLVLDPYVGSGTSLLAAAKLKRRAIGLDQGAEALRISQKRLADAQLTLHRQLCLPRLAAPAKPQVSEETQKAS